MCVVLDMNCLMMVKCDWRSHVSLCLFVERVSLIRKWFQDGGCAAFTEKSRSLSSNKGKTAPIHHYMSDSPGRISMGLLPQLTRLW